MFLTHMSQSNRSIAFANIQTC